MASDTVRLTVQLRDPDNRTRVTFHRDVAMASVGPRANDLAVRAVRMFKKEHAAATAGK